MLENEHNHLVVPRPSRMLVLSSAASTVQYPIKQLYTAIFMVLSSWFRVEVKEFPGSADDLGVVKLLQLGSKISDAICMRRYGVVWVVNMVKLRMAGKLEDFVAKFNESFRAFGHSIVLTV